MGACLPVHLHQLHPECTTLPPRVWSISQSFHFKEGQKLGGMTRVLKLWSNGFDLFLPCAKRQLLFGKYRDHTIYLPTDYYLAVTVVNLKQGLL